MKNLISFLFVLPFLLHGQNTINLTFTGINGSSYAQLASIKVKNLTQDCDTVLFYPDTVLTIYNVGINEEDEFRDEFRLMQNYPNPSADKTSVRLNVPGNGLVSMNIYDAAGRHLLTIESLLEKGAHLFHLNLPGNGIFFLHACWNKCSSSIRIISAGTGQHRACDIEYCGSVLSETRLKSTPAESDFLFSPGDQLLLIGYGNEIESGFPTDAYGFNTVPAGYFVQGGFWGPGYKTYIWSSDYPGKHYRNMDWNQAKINRNTGGNELAITVRCVKN